MKTNTKTRGRATTRSASTMNNGGKAPRGTNIVFKAWAEALDGIPASSQNEVGKAFIAKAREHLSGLKAAAKAQQIEMPTATRGRPKATRNASKSAIKRVTKSGATRKAGGRRRSSNIDPAMISQSEPSITTEGTIN